MLVEKTSKNQVILPLGLHKLKGKLAGKYSVSITMSYRIISTFAVTEKGIILIDIRKHEIYD